MLSPIFDVFPDFQHQLNTQEFCRGALASGLDQEVPVMEGSVREMGANQTPRLRKGSYLKITLRFIIHHSGRMV